MFAGLLRYLGIMSEAPVLTRVYGYKKDKLDSRDLLKTFSLFTHEETSKVDLRSKCPKVYDQGALGSCTANAIGGAYEFDMMKETEDNVFTPSRLFIYYNERKMEGNISEDAGAEIRDGIKSVNKVGICDEKEWPYDISKFTNEPPQNLYDEAKHHLAVKYQRVTQDLKHMKECLHQGFPFVFGFAVYESFESQEVASTGVMPMPKKHEKVLGGHAVMAVGYDDEKKVFIVRNSWTDTWGDEGYFYMPYDFMMSEDCSDFWEIQRVQDDNNYKKVLDKCTDYNNY
jgi:C1A family cysteine protease